MTHSRLPLLKTDLSLSRCYLTLPWVPVPKYNKILDKINE